MDCIPKITYALIAVLDAVSMHSVVCWCPIRNLIIISHIRRAKSDSEQKTVICESLCKSVLKNCQRIPDTTDKTEEEIVLRHMDANTESKFVFESSARDVK